MTRHGKDGNIKKICSNAINVEEISMHHNKVGGVGAHHVK
jgi:hypothetical protein